MTTENFVTRALIDPAFLQEACKYGEEAGFSEVQRNILTLSQDFFAKYHKSASRQDLLMCLADLPAQEREKFGLEYRKSINVLFDSEPAVKSIESKMVFDRFSEVVRKKRIGKLITDTATGFENHDSDWAIKRLSGGLFDRGIAAKDNQIVDLADVRNNLKFALYRGADRLPTAIDALDHGLYGGVGINELMCFVAPSGRGKTFVLINLMCGLLLAGSDVLYVSLETSITDVVRRAYRRMMFADKNYFSYEANMPKIEQHIARVFGYSGSKGRVMYRPANTFSVDDLRAELLRLELSEGFRPKAIIIDHLDLMTTAKKSIRQNEAYAYWRLLVDDLREIPLHEGIHISTATQGTRESSKKALLGEADVGESYGKVQSSDVVISINQTPEEAQAKRMRLAFIKNRDYLRGTEVEVFVDLDKMALCDLIYAQKFGWL